MSEVIVAKFGGSSMADQSLVASRIKEMDVPPQVVVVSAAGKDQECSEKMTDMLIAYDEQRNVEVRKKVLARLSQVAMRARLSPDRLEQFINQAASEMEQFTRQAYPVAALGERWSARLLADITSREYIEAADVVRFDEGGRVDVRTTERLIRERIAPGHHYVMPGFYGATEAGEIRTLDRGGSDVSGALCALALRASEYQNWSDVDGFYTANPREVAEVQPIAELTYREARELANGGSELLHREVGRYLVGSGIPTRMFNTMSGESRSAVVDQRDTSRAALVGVSGMRRMVELSHDDFGSEERIGTSIDLYKTLERHSIPYIHSATSTDTVSIYIDNAYSDKVRLAFENDAIEHVSALHVVGQRLVETLLARAKVLGELAATLMHEGVALKGFTDTGRSPATTLFVDVADYDAALRSVSRYIYGQVTT